MSYGWNRDQSHPSQQSAADLANSFLSSVGQELHSNNHYESQGRYGDYRNEDYRRREDLEHRGSRYRDRSPRDTSRRSRRSSRENRRERSPRYHRRDDYHRSSRRRSVSRHSRRRRTSRSPPAFRREEVDVIPLSKRPRRLHNWDMAPAGMEGMTAQQVKMTGLFPLPGQVVGTRTPQSFQPPPQRMEDATPKQSKKLYVGQIPNTTDEVTLCDFFNATIRHELQDKTPVVGAQINHEKNFAFIEFHTSQQATACMVLDGISFQGNTLKIRRPNHYQPPEEQVPGLSTNVPDTPNKVFVGGLPVYLTDNQVMELLTSFGELRAFNLVKDTATGANKGFAFCEYADPSVTDLACQGLNGMELGDKKLIVQRASVGAKHIPPDYMSGPILPANYVPVTSAKEEDATRVLQLMNMVSPEELEDDEEYQDIWEDIAEECAKFGNIVDMKIPKPQKDQQVPGCGLIFVRYETTDETLAALRALAGRKFADRTVVATFVDEQNYLSDNF
ncbi:hypothetical protein G6F57_001116 [Rhizopus arrhizus]|uniref:Splicing factor U2AF subunit n=1 Tax=Rhizopus oryzae TaxID=64495 RepID=A0A9P6XFJ6_RHIOR|nr:hypothetical protein G6F23_002301 [Rhizopus arrhizus]KAG1428802.1 hypothetical protein G6F58_000391 [Rhizopus delemar]KAG0767818.1 hypothetical protein G6F24_002460 [Rhizopus arrhizus]KAG0798025.1 hypothetical protein G6F21_000065 [Rhizopus arrhizus]KAG0802436.1 hypothetical protein G6F22_000258 [Rhizopus arrhizus]